jgi:hypothetical protein
VERNLPALAASTVKLGPDAPTIISQFSGTAEVFVATAVSHRYQVIVSEGAGKPAHVPPVVVAAAPTRGFPAVAVGAGSVRLAGSRVTTTVDALTRAFEPESFVRVTSTAMYFPASASAMGYVRAVAPVIAEQFALAVFALGVDVVHRNQR